MIRVEHFRRAMTDDPDYQALHWHLSELCGTTRTYEANYCYENAGKGHRALEVGGHPLYFAKALKKKFEHVIATDSFQWAVRPDITGNPTPEEWMSRLGPDVWGQKADATRLPWPDKHFDVACAVSVIEHIGDVEAAVRELCRVARRVVLTTDLSENGKAFSGYDRVFSISSLVKLLHDTTDQSVTIGTLPPQSEWMYPDLGLNVCGLTIET